MKQGWQIVQRIVRRSILALMAILAGMLTAWWLVYVADRLGGP